MMLEKILPYFLLLALFAANCSGPHRTPAPSPKPSSMSERLAKIKMTDLDGLPLTLRDFAGKPVFLNFWATWCGPCVSEMKSIEDASKQFKDDIVFLAVSTESPALIQSFAKKHKLSFKFARLDISYLDAYVVVLPTTMLIDANGQLVAEEEGFRVWNDPSSIQKLRSLAKK
ncbi:MAG: TlpA family protein disulfide reductase [Saprospiraceae bacterium]